MSSVCAGNLRDMLVCRIKPSTYWQSGWKALHTFLKTPYPRTTTQKYKKNADIFFIILVTLYNNILNAMQMTKKKRPDYKRCPLPNEWATDSTGYGLLGNYNTTYQSSDFSDEILTVLGLSNLPGRIHGIPRLQLLRFGAESLPTSRVSSDVTKIWPKEA